MERTIALVACLLLGAALGWLGEQGPRPAPVSAPAEQFSASRAMADVQVIAQAPHPAGSTANARVRDHLIARLEALGLAPEVQIDRPFAARTRGDMTQVYGARVENVIGVLPGADRQAPALALMAHYDSVPGSPGAPDDAAGVAAILEIVRALQARGTPARDVIVILTDGEEIGLLGARAFFERHPLASRVGFVINLEARGSAGRATMFETGTGNGPTLDLFTAAGAGSPSNSLTVFAYRQMPNDTDFSVPRDQGLPGLNYAFTGRQFDYHSPTATPENLSRRSLQDLGAQALAAASHAAYAKALPVSGPDKVYAPTLGGRTLAYGPQTGWLILGAAALLLGIGIFRARRASPGLRLLDMGQGALAGLYVLLAGAALLRFARRASGAGYGFLEQRELLAQAARFEAVLVLLALGVALLAAAACARGRMRLAPALFAGAAGLGCQLFGGWDLPGLALGAAGAAVAAVAFGRAAYRSGAWAGLLASGLVAGAAAQALAPMAAFLVAWPLLMGTVGAALTALGERRPLAARVALVMLAGVGLGWLAGFGHAIYVNLDLPELLAPIAWLAAFLIWPFAHPAIGGAGRITALLLLGAGLVLLAIVRIDPPWSERYPQASLVYYLLDADAERAFMIDAAPGPSSWSRRALARHGEAEMVEATPVFRAPQRGVAVEPAAMAPPQIDLAVAGDRAVLSASPSPGGVLILDIEADSPVTDVQVNGRPAPLLARPGAASRLVWRADAEPVLVSFRPQQAEGTLSVRYGMIAPGWPPGAAPLPPRPAHVMAFDTSDSTIVRGSRSLSW